MRYGLNLACFPDAHTVELVERQIVRQKRREFELEDLEPEITFFTERGWLS
jgi:hypothetical protein